MKLLNFIGITAGIILNFAAGYYLAFVFYAKDIPVRAPIPSVTTCFTKDGLKSHDDLLLKRVIQPVNPFPNSFCPPVPSCPEIICEDCSEDYELGKSDGHEEGFAECTFQNKMYE